MKNLSALFLLFALPVLAFSQAQFLCTNASAEQIMQGNYSPQTYQAANIISHPDSIALHIHQNISADSLKSYLLQLSSFHNRNTGADTVSNTTGIGAARRWAFAKFQSIGAANQNRLLPFYLQFNMPICGSPQHRNICAVLPGTDTTDKSILFVEAHIDSRCETECDINCQAEGMEDNGSGCALVLEMARVMAPLSLKRTVVFALVIGEEQGLFGSEAFADYTFLKGITVKAVLNNDVVGGIICGETSSEPSCPGLNNIDSTHTRLFSFGSFNSPHKQYARYTKLQYKELLKPLATVPMDIWIMTPEDRTGRGGDHIPFRQHGITSIRLTSANEHGDADIDSAYHDRQHSYRDVLGVDTDSDQILDSFFVDFNYLKRNTAINANAITMAALGPKAPDFTVDTLSGNRIRVETFNEFNYVQYRIALRSQTNDWDSVYTLIGSHEDTIELCDTGVYYVSVATMNSQFTEGLFSGEVAVHLSDSSSCVMTAIEEVNDYASRNLVLLQNKPNPFDEATAILVLVNETFSYREAHISITDLEGREVEQIPIALNSGMNEVIYTHGYKRVGIFGYSLVVDGKVLQTRRMVFAN